VWYVIELSDEPSRASWRRRPNPFPLGPSARSHTTSVGNDITKQSSAPLSWTKRHCLLGQSSARLGQSGTYRACAPIGPARMRTLDRLVKAALSWRERHLAGLAACRASPPHGACPRPIAVGRPQNQIDRVWKYRWSVLNPNPRCPSTTF